MRLVVAHCEVNYGGRLTAHLPMAARLILLKADGSVSIHADDRAYKPLNWMSPPCTLTEVPQNELPDGLTAQWDVRGRDGDSLQISIAAVLHDSSYELGPDPGLRKDGVEAHLQALLADHPAALGPGWSLVRREYMTAIGPVDLLCRDGSGQRVDVALSDRADPSGSISSSPTAGSGVYWAVEVKRRATLEAVEQLTRYVELLNRDPLLAPVKGMLAAQTIARQARTLAEDRGLRCLLLDYDRLRGMDDPSSRLF